MLPHAEHFTLDIIARSFEPTERATGLRLFRADAVRNIRPTDNGNYTAIVVDGVPYNAAVGILWSRGEPQIGTNCPCSPNPGCTHAAALAFALAQDVDTTPQRIEPQQWLRQLAAPDVTETPTHRNDLMYVLRNTSVSAIRVYWGGNGRELDVRYEAQQYANTVVDDAILAWLGNGRTLDGNPKARRLRAALYDLAISTSRAHWRDINQPALTRADIRDAVLHWQLGADGLQRPILEGHSDLRICDTDPVWYIDPENNRAGTIEIDGARATATRLLLTAPPLDDEAAARTSSVLQTLQLPSSIPLPTSTLTVDERHDNPVPILRVYGLGEERRKYRIAAANLSFRYGDETVDASDHRDEFQTRSGSALIIHPRNPAFEETCRNRMTRAGFSAGGYYFDEARCFTPRGFSDQRYADVSFWTRFFSVTAPALESEGWVIERLDTFPYSLLDATETWDIDVFEDDGWFSVELGVDVAGKRVPLLPILLEVLKQRDSALSGSPGQPIVVSLGEGRLIEIPGDRAANALALLTEFLADDSATSGKVRVPRIHAAAIEGIKDTPGFDLREDGSLRAFLDRLSVDTPSTINVPATFKGELRPYQRQGVHWLQALHAHEFGGILADDMGLGKTVQMLAHLAIEHAEGRLKRPALIIAPTSVLPNWEAEIKKFVPSFKTLTLHGADRASAHPRLKKAQVVLTSYALLTRDAEYLSKQHWSVAVLDEGQFIKNPRTKAAAAARELHADRRVVLTGTPVENRLEDLWSIYAFAEPTLLGNRERFVKHFRTPIEKRNDVQRRNLLAARVRPFLLRRTKDDVALELPPKTEITQKIELVGAQRDLYETVRLAMHKHVRSEIAKHGVDRSQIEILAALLKLRQVCCDPRLLKTAGAKKVKESAKLDGFVQMLEEMVEGGRRVLVFSSFTSMLDLIEPELEQRSIKCATLRGETVDRKTPVQQFQNGEVPVFLISLKAGGTGLNLTAADVVIHYDPWWNPAVERQATDRAHRIGQDKPVFVYKFIAAGTVEERILELQERKGALAESIFEKSGPVAKTTADVEWLFAPLSQYG